MRRPFTLYKEKTQSGTIWYARFWDETSQRYKHSRSTGILVEGKKERRFEAEEAARKLIDVVAKANLTATSTKTQNLTDFSKGEGKTADTNIIQYLEEFWQPNSEYANFKRDVEKKPLTSYYIEMNHDDVRRHVKPFEGFEGVTVGRLNKATLKKWLIWLASRKTIRKKKDGTIIEGETLSGRRANSIIQAVRVAIRWAVDNEEIATDPFRNLGEVAVKVKEKGVLTFEERQKLTEIKVFDYRSRLIMLLGSFCGLRRGEMRGLQWGDIKNGIITVQHNFIDNEGVKQPKYNSTRKVPIPTAVQEILDITYKNAINTNLESYVLESPQRHGEPLSNNFFRDRVTNELESIGITKAQQKERILTCHSLRHTFVTLAQLSGVPDVIIRALSGHKSEQVQRGYSHVPQVIDYDEARKRLETGFKNLQKAVNT